MDSPGRLVTYDEVLLAAGKIMKGNPHVGSLGCRIHTGLGSHEDI